MNFKKLVASTVAAVLTVSTVAVTASAYDIPASKQILDWVAVNIPAEEFADLSADNPYITVEVSKDINPDGYHCVKPILNDWTPVFEESMTKFASRFAKSPNFNDSSYSVASGDDVENEEDKFEYSKVTFEVPASMIDTIKAEGMSLAGKGAKATKIYVATEKPTVFYDVDGNVITEGGASNNAPADNSNTAGNVNQTTGDKNSPDTGVEGVAVVAGIAIIAAGAIVISKKRK